MREVESTRGVSVELSGVGKDYGDVAALRDVSMRIEPGEFVTLLGPSGSGKTTTLNLIAGFTSPSHGRIALDGVPIDRLPPHKRNLGMIFQNYALFPHMRVFDNIAYPLKQRRVGKAEIQARVQDALELVGLGEVGRRYPRQLSGGQQQRVAVARAIVFNPRVLLMDEPLGALDRQLRESLQAEIKRIHRELEITFIYVTHDQEEALALSDRVAVFNRGRIEQVGSPADLYERPQTRFVAEFVGEANIFEGQAATEADGRLVCKGRGLAVQSVRRGQTATLLLRPESLRIVAATASGCDNVLAGSVADLAFLGPTKRVRVDLDIGQRVVLRTAADAAPGLLVGDRVHVGWNAADGVLVTDGPSGAESVDRDAPEPQLETRARTIGAEAPMA